MIIFDDLINIMGEIYDLYLKLYRLELLGEINTNYFFSLVGDLKKLLIREEEIFNKFVKTSEYEYIKDDVLEENGPLFNRLKDYIILHDNTNVKDGDVDENKLTEEAAKLYKCCSKNIFLIYLSFMQEYIETIGIDALRERMLSLKYYKAFTKLDIGKLLIEYKFQVPRENYIDLYLIADIVKMEEADSFDTILDAHLSVITEMMKQLFNVDDERYKDENVVVASKNIEFMIMACFSLLSESDYEFIKDNIFELVNELSNDTNSITSEIIDNILDSRRSYKSRVRKISLRPIDD